MFRVVLKGLNERLIVATDESLDFDALGLTHLGENERDKRCAEYRALYAAAENEPLVIPAFLITETSVTRIDANVAIDGNGRVSFAWRAPRSF